MCRIYRGALWILGEYCSTKDDIQSVMTEVRRSLGEVCFISCLPPNKKNTRCNSHTVGASFCGLSCACVVQIPIVENEIKRESGEVKAEEEVSAAPAQKLVTEMGTYVTQSALSSSRPSKKEEDRSVPLLPQYTPFVLLDTR